MRELLQTLREVAWPSKSAPHGPLSNWDVYLRPLLVLTIVLLAGPDIVALVEVSTLLDLLGATLFLTAMLVWHKLVLASVLDTLRRLFVPTEYAVLLQMRAQPLTVVAGALLIVATVAMRLMVCLTLVVVAPGLVNELWQVI